MANKVLGYMGRILRVDLSNESITDEEISDKVARKYIGGTGLGAKYLYEEVPPGTEWFDAGNRLIIASGPLGATVVGGSGTISIVTKGALTNGAAASQANGFFGAFLRLSGYDGIVLQGVSKKWVYLLIDKDKVELRDASHLVGKNTWDTGELIKSELGRGERGISVASIGPAGENLVRFAMIFIDKGHVASHNGVGAVMGSKRLKAIAVSRGNSYPQLADKEGVSAIGKQLYDSLAKDPANLTYKWGTLPTIVNVTGTKNDIIPVKNYTTAVYQIEREKLEKFGPSYIRSHFNAKPNPCWGCKMHHTHISVINEGPYSGKVVEEPDYEQFATWGPLIGQTDVAAAIMLSHEVDCLGLDSNETGWVIGLVMECYEKGILKKEDCDGLEMNWGNANSARELIRRIATREGLGNILAEGVMRAARTIGGEALNFAIHTMKGNTPSSHDLRSRWPLFLDTCVSQSGAAEGFSMYNPGDVGLSIGSPSNRLANVPPEDAVIWNAQCKGATQFQDSLGVCAFTTKTDLKSLAKAISAATGWDFSAKEGLQVGKRIINLMRVFNIRHGHTAEMDAPSPRLASVPIDGPSQGKDIMLHWSNMRRNYYELMGWEGETGKPLPETLKNLGLEYTIPEIWGNI